MKKEGFSSLGLLAIAIIWGFAFVAVDYALVNGWQTFTILAFRGLIAGTLLLPFVFKSKIWKQPKLCLHTILAGVFFFLGYAFQTYGQHLSSVVNSAFYTCLYVIFTPFLALLFGRREVNLQTYLGAFTAIIGIFFLSVLAKGGQFSFAVGDILLVLCAFFFALQIIWISHFMSENKDPLATSSIMLLTMGICSLICLPFAHESLPNSLKGFGGVLFAALLSSGVCSVLQFICQSQVNASKSAIILGLETPFACVFSWLIGSDSLNQYAIIGLALMMISVILVSVNFTKKYDFSKYKILLFDVDETLLNFRKAEKYAFKRMLKSYGYVYHRSLLKEYSRDNDCLWKQYERGEISREDIFNNRLVSLFINHHFTASPQEASYRYLKYLEDGAFILRNSRTELKRLAKKYRLFVISNGEPSVQYSRLTKTGIIDYFEQVFVSSEIGYQKPKKEFFDYVASHIDGFKNEEAIVVGDSLTSDILGAIRYNIDACWFNLKRQKTDLAVKYNIRSLSQIE